MTNLDDASKEFNDMSIGESMVYYSGFLCRDRYITTDMNKEQKARCGSIGQLGDHFHDLFRLNRAALIQRKLGESFYEYLATKLK